MADLNGTVTGGQTITGTIEPQAEKLRGALRLRSGGGGVTDVWQNGESVLDGTIGKVTVPTNTSDLTNDSGFITTETDPVFGASPAKNITASNISTWNGKQDALVSGTNIKTVNNTSLLGSGNVAVQETLVSGTNIKTINGNDLLGSGNIVIQGGGGSTVSYTQTQTSGNELGTITIDGDSKKIYSPTETDPTVPSWAKASSKPSYTASEVGAVPTSRTVNGKALSSNISLTASDVGAQETLVSGTNIKTVNSTSLLGSGNVAVQPTLVSGTNIKTVNSTSLLGSGNVAVQPTLVSGTNIKTVNNESLLGSGNITIQGGAGADVIQVSITVANWNATTTCTKTVTGVTTSNSVIVSPAPSSISDYVSAGVYCSAQASGTLTFTAASTPTADLTVNVMIVG